MGPGVWLPPGLGTELSLRRLLRQGAGLGPQLSPGSGPELDRQRVPEMGTGPGLGSAPETGTGGRLRRWLLRRVWPRC